MPALTCFRGMLNVLAASVAPHPPFRHWQKGVVKFMASTSMPFSMINFTANVLSKPPDRSPSAFVVFPLYNDVMNVGGV